MIVRRGPAIVLILGMSAAALVGAPSASASDGGTVEGDRPGSHSTNEEIEGAPYTKAFSFDGEKEAEECGKGSRVKIKVDTDEDGRLITAGIVWSDDDNLWDWRFRHNDDVSAKGDVRAADSDEGKSFKIVRTMVNMTGPDYIQFRAEDQGNGEDCKVDLYY